MFPKKWAHKPPPQPVEISVFLKVPEMDGRKNRFTSDPKQWNKRRRAVAKRKRRWHSIVLLLVHDGIPYNDLWSPHTGTIIYIKQRTKVLITAQVKLVGDLENMQLFCKQMLCSNRNFIKMCFASTNFDQGILLESSPRCTPPNQRFRFCNMKAKIRAAVFHFGQFRRGHLPFLASFGL